MSPLSIDSAASAIPEPADFAEAFQSRNNSFGFLRFFFAAMVVFSHSYALGGFGAEPLDRWSRGQETFGGVAVAAFFILSGFLITRSYTRTPSPLVYLWHRGLRILPGFWVCLVVTAFVFAPIIWVVEHGSLRGFFAASTDNPFLYVMSNSCLFMYRYGVAGLLGRLPLPRAFDGSLWSLYYELKCYIAVAVLGIVGIIPRQKRLVGLLFLAFWAVHLLDVAVPGAAGRLVPYFRNIYNLKLPMYFLAGSAFYLYSKSIVFSTRLFIFSFALILLGLRYQFFLWVAPVAGCYTLFWLAFRLPLSWFDKPGDFSYGLYIYSFPVQQMLAYFGGNRHGLYPYFALAMLISCGLAVLSYRFVEKPCLDLKNWHGPFARRRLGGKSAVPGPHRIGVLTGGPRRTEEFAALPIEGNSDPIPEVGRLDST